MNNLVLKVKGIGILESEKVYLYYDEPLIFLCKDQFGNKYLMLRQADEIPVWLGVIVSSERLDELESNCVEIKNAFVYPESGYVLRISGNKDLCDVNYLTADELTGDMLPFSGEYLDYEKSEKGSDLDALLEIYKNVSLKLGITADDIKALSPQDMRAYIENKSGEKIRFVSEFPTIGRGNVLRDSIITREELDKDIDRLLGIGSSND